MGYSGSIDRSNKPGAKAEANQAERRRHNRDAVLKAGRLIINEGRSVLNCLILDESPDGVFVDMGAIVALPRDVIIQYASGATFPAVLRWNAGSKCGFQFSGPQIISHETAKRMEVISEILTNHGLTAAVDMLRGVQYFDNPELERIALEAAAAQSRLEAALHGQKFI
jgi:hypothetical protein